VIFLKSRLNTEKKVFRDMVVLYCKKNHTVNSPCEECKKIIDYGFKKIEICPYGESKPFCSKCSIHCYEKNMQKKVKEIMRYSGPRIIFYHPIASLKHLISSIF
jgi:hypothetical protein